MMESIRWISRVPDRALVSVASEIVGLTGTQHGGDKADNTAYDRNASKKKQLLLMMKICTAQFMMIMKMTDIVYGDNEDGGHSL